MITMLIRKCESDDMVQCDNNDTVMINDTCNNAS